MSGGAGYVMSREALTKFGREGCEQEKCMFNLTGKEDVAMGQCLQDIGERFESSNGR